MENFTSSNSSSFLSAGESRYAFIEEYLQLLRLLTYVWPAIILFGCIANITNIVVFLKTGVKDNVTVLLLSLSVSDLAFLALITPSMSAFIIDGHIWPSPWPFHKHLLMFSVYWPAFTAYDLSAFISVSLGVIRCACVAIPLKFKRVFTKSRTIKWVFFLVVLVISLRLPVLTIFRITWRTDPRTNISALYLASVNRESMSRINDILNRGFLIWFNYLTMITCVIVLSYKLYQASKIRQDCTVKRPQLTDHASNEVVTQRMATKDLQVVKSVILVCSIFIMSQLPFVMFSATRLIYPKFDGHTSLEYLFGIVSQISNTLSYINASINIFVYYNYNSRYRSVLISTFAVFRTGINRKEGM